MMEVSGVPALSCLGDMLRLALPPSFQQTSPLSGPLSLRLAFPALPVLPLRDVKSRLHSQGRSEADTISTNRDGAPQKTQFPAVAELPSWGAAGER